MPDLCTQHTTVIFDVRLGHSQLGSFLNCGIQPTKQSLFGVCGGFFHLFLVVPSYPPSVILSPKF